MPCHRRHRASTRYYRDLLEVPPHSRRSYLEARSRACSIVAWDKAPGISCLLASTSTVKQERGVCDASTVKMSCKSLLAERLEFDSGACTELVGRALDAGWNELFYRRGRQETKQREEVTGSLHDPVCFLANNVDLCSPSSGCVSSGAMCRQHAMYVRHFIGPFVLSIQFYRDRTSKCSLPTRVFSNVSRSWHFMGPSHLVRCRPSFPYCPPRKQGPVPPSAISPSR